MSYMMSLGLNILFRIAVRPAYEDVFVAFSRGDNFEKNLVDTVEMTSICLLRCYYRGGMI